jgi:excisionase family DNA binding protein
VPELRRRALVDVTDERSISVSATGNQLEPGLPAYLTPAQVAELLQVSEKTVSRWHLEDASMPCIKRGKVVRFPRAALMEWLARQDRSRRQKNHSSVTQQRSPAA